jgi:co-chaperonin GroES (HSP10)
MSVLELKTMGQTSSVSSQVDLKKAEAALDEAFPNIDPGMIPLGSRILVQLRQPKKMAGTKGLIHIADETKDAEKWHTQVARVVALGPVAFKARKDLEAWPEGEWCRVGDFVRVPKYNGDRIEVPIPGSAPVEKALFAVFNDLELIAKVTGDPLAILAYI